MRDLQLPVSCQDVRKKGVELVIPPNFTFKASVGWFSQIFQMISPHIEGKKIHHTETTFPALKESRELVFLAG